MDISLHSDFNESWETHLLRLKYCTLCILFALYTSYLLTFLQAWISFRNKIKLGLCVRSYSHSVSVISDAFTRPCKFGAACMCVCMLKVHRAIPGCDINSFIFPVVFATAKEWREEKGGVLFLVKEWKNRARLPLRAWLPCDVILLLWLPCVIVLHVLMRRWSGVPVMHC